jgi:tRNA(adenine34) deaminase
MDEKFMRRAIELAKQAKAEGNFPFGAVIVKGNQIISEGRCLEVVEHDVTKHAELLAVSGACTKLQSVDLSDCTLYASGEPCNMCASAAFQADIGRVVIGAVRAKLMDFFRQRAIGIRELAKDSSHHIEIVTGIMEPEAIALFDGLKRK